MRNKTNQVKNRRTRPAWVEMFAKTERVEARTDHGRDWHTDVPNIKLSRAFVVVLVLHVVAVGGILAFEMFKPGSRSADTIADTDEIQTISADEPAGDPAATGDPAGKTPAMLREEQMGGYERYIVQAGDTIRNIAEGYRISRSELLTANRIDEQHPLVNGRILRIPKALLPGGSSMNLQPVIADEPRGDTPPVASSLSETELLANTPPAALPVPETLVVDDGFTPIGIVETPPVSPTPTPDPVAETDDGYQRMDPDPENERPLIVVPNTLKKERPRILRELPAAGSETATAAAGRSHTVVAGDTLYRISRKYGVGVDSILSANPGVRAESLGIGKTLRIP